MQFINNKMQDIQIAYIGGGSRGWAWGLMSDLASAPDISGKVSLQDIDHVAAENNVIIVNIFRSVEAVFSDNSVVPCFAGDIQASIYGLISKVVGVQDLIVEAGMKRDLDIAFRAFTNDNLVTIDTKSVKVLFDEMVQNTKEYLKDYNV